MTTLHSKHLVLYSPTENVIAIATDLYKRYLSESVETISGYKVSVSSDEAAAYILDFGDQQHLVFAKYVHESIKNGSVIILGEL